ncbi:MAG: rhomboid family intramembrane serine protease [Hadesarchaea archaeon]|nr:rhomboid family intramembrane serine protease [Hadesarchaea archaeon]
MTKSHRLLAGFRPILKALLIFLILNFGIFVLLSCWPSLLGWLWLSADRPWGIITSAFSHVDLDHIVSNVVGFIFAAALFVLINLNKSEKARRRLSNRFLLLAFVAGITANLLQYPFFLLRTGKSSYGASGIVYGALGIVFSCALHDLPSNIRFIARERRRLAARTKKRRSPRFTIGGVKFFSSLFAISVVVSLLLLVLFDISAFLNIAPEVDVFAHGVGFLAGLVLFVGFQMFSEYRK